MNAREQIQNEVDDFIHARTGFDQYLRRAPEPKPNHYYIMAPHHHHAMAWATQAKKWNPRAVKFLSTPDDVRGLRDVRVYDLHDKYEHSKNLYYMRHYLRTHKCEILRPDSYQTHSKPNPAPNERYPGGGSDTINIPGPYVGPVKDAMSTITADGSDVKIHLKPMSSYTS